MSLICSDFNSPSESVLLGHIPLLDDVAEDEEDDPADDDNDLGRTELGRGRQRRSAVEEAGDAINGQEGANTGNAVCPNEIVVLLAEVNADGADDYHDDDFDENG